MKTVWTHVVLAMLLAWPAAAQDAQSVLQASAKAMGDADSVQYVGTGWIAAPGQSYTPDRDWPRFELSAYTRVLDYRNSASTERYTRRQGSYPAEGGGNSPIIGEQHLVLEVVGSDAWNVDGTATTPQAALAEMRQLDIWLSPHGFLRAARGAKDATAVQVTLEGRPMTIVSFTALGKYRVNGTINEHQLVERTQTWVPNPVFGDMVYEHRFTEYKNFGGLNFPTLLHSHQGDPRIHPGHNSMEVRVTSVSANTATTALAIPANIRGAGPAPVRVASSELATGVWRIAGGSHHSVAVEFRDFVAVVEAPLSEERSLAVITEVKRLIPGKPIRYVVNTHHHFDHSGGLRTYVAHGATVLTHDANRQFYWDVFFHPGRRTLTPDLLADRMPWFASNRVPTIEAVSHKYVVSDGVRTLDLHPIQGLAHAGSMLVAYLPTERILINADLYSPPAPAAAPITAADIRMRSLQQNIQRLGLLIDRHVGIHGDVAPHAEFVRLTGGK